MPGGTRFIHDRGVRRRHGSAVAPDQHQRGAEHHLPPFTLALPVSLAAERDLRDVLIHAGTAHVLWRCPDLAEVLDALYDADHAPSPLLDKQNPHIVGFNRADDLAEGEP
jgi:hypothetical protein